jgi:hypothetical protein
LVSNGCETNLSTSLPNCGGCGANCALANASETCISGACTLGTCDSGFANCDGNAANGCEANLMTEPTHCGGCLNSCNLANATASCSSGVCAISNCNSGFANCDGNAVNGCEVNLKTDANNCNACRDRKSVV